MTQSRKRVLKEIRDVLSAVRKAGEEPRAHAFLPAIADSLEDMCGKMSESRAKREHIAGALAGL